MANYSLVSLLLVVQHAHAAFRTRQHAVQNSSLRGSPAAVHPPTPKPTPHPTIRDWFSTDYPTAYPTNPTNVPTYDFSSYMPTPIPSSYFPTSEMPTPTLDYTGNSSLRGSAAAVHPPTPKPTPHPTIRDWFSTDYPTAYPTAYPTNVPTYDFSSYMSTPIPSSYFPTSEMPTPTPDYTGDIRTRSREEPATFTISSSATTKTAEDIAEEMPSSTIIHGATTTSINNESPSGIGRPVTYSNPERPAPIMSSNLSTAATTSKPTNPTVVNTLAEDETSSSSQTWMELVTDDFEENYGIFHPGSVEYVTYYPFVKGRRGVLRIQHGSDMSSSIYSDNIALDNASTTSESKEIKIVFSYYANSMELHDGFCLDYSVDDGSSWNSERCWHAVDNFDNGMWYDDASVTFELSQDHHDVYDNMDGFRIRFRCMADSANDDVLIDKITVLELVETDLKNST